MLTLNLKSLKLLLNLLCELNLTNSVIFPRKLHKNICSGSGPNLQMSLDIENIITDEMLVQWWQCALLLPCSYCNWVSTHHCTVTPEQAAIITPGHDWIIICSMQPLVQWSTLPSVCPPCCLSMAMSPCRHVAISHHSARILTCSDSDPAKKFYTREANLCIESVSNYVYWTAARLISQNCGKSSQFFLAYNLFGNLHNNRSMLILEMRL